MDEEYSHRDPEPEPISMDGTMKDIHRRMSRSDEAADHTGEIVKHYSGEGLYPVVVKYPKHKHE
jgi:hypothetical protein